MHPLAEKALTLTDVERQRLYCRVLDNDDGKLLLEDLKWRGFFYAPTTHDGSGEAPRAVDPNLALINEGSRRLVITMLNLMEPVSEPKGGQ